MRLEIELGCILFPLIILIIQLIGHWKGTHLSISGPTFDSACQSKNQATRLKELSVELRDRIVLRHSTSGEGYLSRWYKGIGRQAQECVIVFFIYPNYSVPCKNMGTKTKQTRVQNTGLKPKQKSED
jgi:hypothetical protein